MARLTTDIVIAAGLRQAASRGIFAAILRKGDARAGAIFVEVEKSATEARLLARQLNRHARYLRHARERALQGQYEREGWANTLALPFISPFVGRLDDIGQDGMGLIEEICTIYDQYGFETGVLVASVRSTQHVVDAALLGADVVTLPLATSLTTTSRSSLIVFRALSCRSAASAIELEAGRGISKAAHMEKEREHFW